MFRYIIIIIYEVPTKFEGATALPVCLLLLAQTNKAEQHVGVHED